MRRTVGPSLVAIALLVSACADDGSIAAACSPVTTSSTDLDAKPVIEVPEGKEPPVSLLTCDVVVGTGEEVETGDEVTVHFVGATWSDGEEFNASWDRNEPFQLQIGQGVAPVPGWELGLPGMRVGGRRELIIPPHQGYGPDGREPEVGPNETLVFVIDLLSKDA